MRYVTVNGQEHELPNEQPRGRDLAELVYDLAVSGASTLQSMTAVSGTVSLDVTNMSEYIAHTLTGNITIAAPTGMHSGQKLTFLFTQDGTGGRTVTWNSAFLNNWSNVGNVASAKAAISFVYDGSKWVQVASLDYAAAVIDADIKAASISSVTATTFPVLSTVGGAVSGTAIKLAATEDMTNGTLVTIGDNNTAAYAEKVNIDYTGKIATSGGLVSNTLTTNTATALTLTGTTANGGSAVATAIGSQNAFTTTSKLVSITNATVEKAAFQSDGALGITGVASTSNAITLPATSRIYWNTDGALLTSSGTTVTAGHSLGAGSTIVADDTVYSSNNTLSVHGKKAASGTAEGVQIGTTLTYGSGDKPVVFHNNDKEVSSIDYNGAFTGRVAATGDVTIAALATPVNDTHVVIATGGDLTAATYYYRVSATNAFGETLASTETSVVVSSGTENSIRVQWNRVVGATGYKVYGRTTGAQTLLTVVGTVSDGNTLSVIDLGAATAPDGATNPPAANTTLGIRTGTAATLPIVGTVADAGTAIKLAANTDMTSGTIVTIGDNNGTSYSEKAKFDFAGNAYVPSVISSTAATLPIASTVADAGTAIKLAANTDLTSGTIVTIGDNNGTSYSEKAKFAYNGALTVSGVASDGDALAIPANTYINLGQTGCKIRASGSQEIDIGATTVYLEGTNAVLWTPAVKARSAPSTLKLTGNGDDSGANTTSVTVDTDGAAYTVAGSKLLACKNNTVEKSSVSKDGIYTGGIAAVGGAVCSALATPVNATHTTTNTGGDLADGTYYYRVSATNGTGETLASTETSIIVPAGTVTNKVTVKWGHVQGATGYKVYGRTTGAETLLTGGTITDGSTLQFDDTGTATAPGATALPTVNTTGGICTGTANTLPIVSTVADAGTAIKLAANTDLTSGTIVTIGDNNGTSYSEKAKFDFAGNAYVPSVISSTAATLPIASTVADAGTAIKLAANTDLTSGKIVTVGDNNGTSYSEKLSIDYAGAVVSESSYTGTKAYVDEVIPKTGGYGNSFKGLAPNSAAGVACYITNSTTLNTAGAKLVSLSANNYGTECASIDYLGDIAPAQTSYGTAASGTGITVNKPGVLRSQLFKVTVTYTNFTTNGTTHDVTIWTLPAKSKVVRLIADVTAAFTDGAGPISAITMTAGSSAGGNQYLLSGDVLSGTITLGDIDGEIGASLNAASGGIGDFKTGTNTVQARFTATGGDFATAGVTNLTAGSVTFYLEAVLYP